MIVLLNTSVDDDELSKGKTYFDFGPVNRDGSGALDQRFHSSETVLVK